MAVVHSASQVEAFLKSKGLPQRNTLMTNFKVYADQGSLKGKRYWAVVDAIKLRNVITHEKYLPTVYEAFITVVAFARVVVPDFEGGSALRELPGVEQIAQPKEAPAVTVVRKSGQDVRAALRSQGQHRVMWMVLVDTEWITKEYWLLAYDAGGNLGSAEQIGEVGYSGATSYVSSLVVVTHDPATNAIVYRHPAQGRFVTRWKVNSSEKRDIELLGVDPSWSAPVIDVASQCDQIAVQQEDAIGDLVRTFVHDSSGLHVGTGFQKSGSGLSFSSYHDGLVLTGFGDSPGFMSESYSYWLTRWWLQRCSD